MEKFAIKGSNSDKFEFHLALPKAKHFQIQAVFKGEKQLQVQHVINDAVKSKHKTYGSCTYGHIKPFIRQEDGSWLDLPKSLQHILAKHPLPLSQGPVLLPLDTDTEDNLTTSDVLRLRTCFSHDDSQPCSEWFPSSIGGSGWGEARYEVRASQYSLSGAASTRSMGLVYTCTVHDCVIHCPCTICTDPNAKCKLQCRTEVCQRVYQPMSGAQDKAAQIVQLRLRPPHDGHHEDRHVSVCYSTCRHSHQLYQMFRGCFGTPGFSSGFSHKVQVLSTRTPTLRGEVY